MWRVTKYKSRKIFLYPPNSLVIKIILALHVNYCILHLKDKENFMAFCIDIISF